MATFTAQILVGHAHQNHGGIIPTHQLFLSENSRPAWVLAELETGKMIATWIPTVENMLEDGLAMILRYVLESPEICRILKDVPSDMQFYDLPEKTRQRLYALVRECPNECKLVVTVLAGSSIIQQLGVLKNLSFDIEACLTKFHREYSAWTDSTSIEGEL